jgi:hypothetical protein
LCTSPTVTRELSLCVFSCAASLERRCLNPPQGFQNTDSARGFMGFRTVQVTWVTNSLETEKTIINR